ncbi:uncharacterized protein [Apostichopus japonicus]|uniref:uncharacterized protein isoform X1 n=2 Tax=Stichopus japonicus TaxID=307972 RepID=UPI003AB8BDF8
MDILQLCYALMVAITAICVASGNDPCRLLDSNVCEVCICASRNVDCSNRNLTAIPSYIPNDTYIINLENNGISCIPKDYFRYFAVLFKLTIEMNSVTEPFIPPTSMKKLIANKNLLERIELIFSQCEHLEEVNLQTNRIAFLPDYITRNCSKLIHLDLRNNLFDRINQHSLGFLPRLIDLSLSLNRNLRHIDEGALNPVCESLQKLGMTGCDMLGNVPRGLIRGCTQLKTLSLSSNNITYIDGKMFYSQIGLHYISFRSNPIIQLDDSTFKHLTWIQSLVLSNASLTSIPAKFFNSTSIFRDLDLSSNRLITIPEELFSSKYTNHRMIRLTLSDNQLEYIPPTVFSHLRRLQQLYLDGNSLFEIPEGMLSFTSVDTLFIFRNQIANLTKSLYLPNSQYNPSKLIEAQRNPVQHLSVEFLKGIQENGEIILTCSGLYIPTAPYNINIDCVENTFQTTIKVIGADQRDSLLQRGFNCTQTEPKILRRYTCVACAQGSYTSLQRREVCKPCPRGGFYQDEVGQFQRLPNVIACNNCNNGTFVAKGGGVSPLNCTVCPEGTIKSRHAGYRACFCMDNYFRRDRFGGCELCPQAGLRCENDFVTIEPGFYWNWTLSNISEYKLYIENLQKFDDSYDETTASFSGSLAYVHPCRQKFKCDNKNDTVEGNCHRGYTGFMCTECAEKYFPVMNLCHECPQTWVFLLEVAVGLLLLAGCCFYVVYTYRRKRHEEARSIIDVALARGKIVLGFYQVMGEFWDSLDVLYWPEVFKQLSGWLDLLQFNISTIFIKPSCLVPSVSLNAYSEFLIGIIVTVSVALVPAMAVCLRKVRAKFFQGDSSNSRSQRLRQVVIIKQDTLLFATLLGLFITYPSTCNSTITLYRPACQTFTLDETMLHNVSLLRSDLSINCNTNTHRKFEIAAYVFSLYIVAFPGLLFYLLWKYRKDSSGQDSTRSSSLHPKWLRFLNENYKDQFWYWEIVEITRKVSQTCIVILFGWGSSLSIFITIFLAVIFFTLHASFSPMKDKFEQQLQLASLLAIFLNMLMVAVPAYETDSLFVKETMKFILIFLNIGVLGVTFGKPLLKLAKVIYVYIRGRRRLIWSPEDEPIPERNNNFHMNCHHLLINGDQSYQGETEDSALLSSPRRRYHSVE